MGPVQPETRYARSGDVNVAYQVVGDGPFDLVYVPGWVSHIELAWEEPHMARFLRRLASFSRLILFDKRGTGMSDPVPVDRPPTLEERMDDVRAVMDAVGSERAAILGHSEGGNMSLLFAATYPQRTVALVTFGIFAKRVWSPDYPWAPSPEEREAWYEEVERDWGGGMDLSGLAPSMAEDRAFTAWANRYFRMGASPGAALALARMNTDIDVSDVLPLVRVPTLLLHRVGDRDASIEEARYIAARIPGARLIELPGEDHLAWTGNQDEVLDAVEEFLTGRPAVREPHRVLATVLFTDIVGSTKRAADLGDRRWHDLLEAHNAAARRELERFRGREVDTAGDGFLATFDGPARAVRCALAVSAAVEPLGLAVRAGVHTGEIELAGDDVRGIAVHIGARVAAMAGPGEVLASSTVKDLTAGAGIAFEDRGEHTLRGVPGTWRIYAATG
ncbi:MAG: adenylate/guanylate cyclase domain-containing protein [Actinobacteria bacterium]|nr:adenylate/guanylate cyclase domain-containing protein [Actinomycetota bacterium]